MMPNPKNLIAFDTETHLIRPGLLAPRLVCGSFAMSNHDRSSRSGWLAGSQVATIDEITACLEDRKCIIAGHNIAYDMAVLMAFDPSLTGLIFQAYNQDRIFDTMLGCMLIAIHQGSLGRDPKTGEEIKRYSLQKSVKLWLGRDNAKDNDSWRLRYGELDGIPVELWPAEARQYPVDDAVNTLELAECLIATEDVNLKNMGAQARAALALHLSSVWGQRTSAPTIAGLKKRISALRKESYDKFVGEGLFKPDGKVDRKRLKTLVAQAYGAAGQCPTCHGSGKVTSPSNKNKKNPTQINCETCDSTGLDLSLAVKMPRTPAGAIGADRDGISECDSDILTGFGKVSEYDKILQTYIPFLESGVDTPINVSANPLLETGRVSFEGLTQTIPRGHNVRECFVPRPGFGLVSVDYDAVESSTLAQAQINIVGTSALGDAITAGLDPHAFFASCMIGMDYQEFMVILKDEAHPRHKEIKGYRQGAKEGNFGFPGGMGAATLVRSARKKGVRFCVALGGAPKCGLKGKVTEWQKRPTAPVCLACVEKAQQLKQQWRGQWVETDQYFEHISEITNSTCEVEQIRSGRVRGGLDFCNAANTYFQGLAADGAKDALWRVTEAMYNKPESPLFGCRVFAFVHDEILMEAPLERAHEAAFELARIMVEAMKEWVPDVKISASPALMLAWSKDATMVKDKDGRLIPWVREIKK